MGSSTPGGAGRGPTTYTPTPSGGARRRQPSGPTGGFQRPTESVERERLGKMCLNQAALTAANIALDVGGMRLIGGAAIKGWDIYKAGLGGGYALWVEAPQVARGLRPGLLPSSMNVTGTALGPDGSFNSLDALKFAGGLLPGVGSVIGLVDTYRACAPLF